MDKKMEENWKIVRNRVCIRALLIFLGIVLMQMLAYMVCVIVMLAGAMAGGEGRISLSELPQSVESGEFMIWVSLVSALLSMIWCGILYLKSDWREPDFDYRRAFNIRNTAAVFGAGIGGCLVLTMFLTFLAMLIPQAFSAYNTVMDSLTDSSLTVTVVYVLIVGPISEELIFRGAILDRFYLAFPFLLANLLQAALFGLYHMNLIQGLYALCLGFVLGLIRQATGSILASILAHILFNSTSYGLDLLFPAGQEIELWQMLCLAVSGLLLSVLSIRYFWMKGYHSSHPDA